MDLRRRKSRVDSVFKQTAADVTPDHFAFTFEWNFASLGNPTVFSRRDANNHAISGMLQTLNSMLVVKQQTKSVAGAHFSGIIERLQLLDQIIRRSGC